MHKMKLNLGYKDDKREGYINTDKEDFDLNVFPYPYKDNSFEEVVIRSVLEHLDKPELVLKEIHRICKKDSLVKIRVPHFSSIHAWGELEHRRPFSLASFRTTELKGFVCDYWKIESSRVRFFWKIFTFYFPVFYEKHLAYKHPATDIVVWLRVVK